MVLQPTLENELIRIVPLKETDFDVLYAIASDPEIWEQHPNKDRYKKPVFQVFFEGAIESKGAFLVFDNVTGTPIGSSRFYDWNETGKSIFIGYTFIAKDHWGSTYNPALKKLMLDYAFNFVDTVYFHIGANNIRSQMAITRLGAKKVREVAVEYYGEDMKLNVEFCINRHEWNKQLSW